MLEDIEVSIRVMLVDDHAIIREGIKQLLEFDGTMEVVGEAADGEACLDKIYMVKPDVLLLDINIPKKNGIEVLEELRRRKFDVKVLMLTVHNEVEYLMKAVDLEVDGYILKDAGSNELKKAIKTILSGHQFIQPNLIPMLNSKMVSRDNDKVKIDSLTRRELEVLIQVANGNFNKEIATSLNISERTVKNHISNIFKKIDVNDRTQAAVFAIKNDIVKI